MESNGVIQGYTIVTGSEGDGITRSMWWCR
jgi:hypothetical protein